MQLPILPPAPKIPELPRKISQMVSIAKKLSKIYCIIKSGIGLVGENAVKARIEQMTQRSYEVPWVDRLDLTHYFKQTPLQGIDLQVDSFVNLQYNFDGFYALLKSLVENVNQSTMEVVSQVQNLSDQISEAQDQATQELNDFTNQNVELNADIKITAREQLYHQVKDLEKQLSSPQEQEKLTPILQLAREQAKIEKNHVGLKNIEDQLNTLLTQEKNALHHQAKLAKNDYTQFLKTLEKKEKPSPIQLSFSTSLLQSEKDLEAKIEGKNPTEMLITTEAKRLDGYLLALQKHSAQDLNMKPESYEQSKAYLQAIKSKLGQRNALRSSSYAGTQTLISKSGKTSDKTLLTQVGSSRPASYEQATHDLSSFIKGVLVRDHQRNLVNVVHSEHNYEQFPSYYQQDMNNDGSPEVITWDQYTVYIKYAHDAETKLNQQHKNYYLITPNLKNKAKKYETLKGGRFGKDQSLKVYDENWEVKNFKL